MGCSKLCFCSSKTRFSANLISGRRPSNICGPDISMKDASVPNADQVSGSQTSNYNFAWKQVYCCSRNCINIEESFIYERRKTQKQLKDASAPNADHQEARHQIISMETGLLLFKKLCKTCEGMTSYLTSNLCVCGKVGGY